MENKVKVIAMHLPQFHETQENNEWYGKGYTEWTNVVKAQRYSNDHIQPRVPLNKYYYDLLDKDTVKWQYELSSKYNIYGFCYYHYWFEGRMILEKPAEKLLAYTDIPQKFCFCWANQSWRRINDLEKDASSYLIKQTYGKEEDCKAHYDYLEKFFLDDRYIKIDNKPVMLLYITKDIDNCDEFIEYFNARAKLSGFNGIHFVETLTGYQAIPTQYKTNAAAYFEPLYTFQKVVKNYFTRALYKLARQFKTISYKKNFDTIWHKILSRDYSKFSKPQYPGAFLDWDNTSRKGKGGTYVKGFNIEKFGQYFRALTEKAKSENAEFIFFNAWNEWGESAYLEPDEVNGVRALEIIKETLQV